ncbi:MAG: DUF3052 family protein [Actinomycetales bacterium]|nr:DUF3052 family protein [Actinomycetales bacterium]
MATDASSDGGEPGWWPSGLGNESDTKSANSAGSLAPGRAVRWTTARGARWHGVGDAYPKRRGVVVTAGAESEARVRAGRLGLQPGQSVMEIGYDADVDEDLRLAIEEIIGAEMVDEDFDDVVDVVLMWWREDDGDLVDALMDAIGPLADQGVVWLITPKPGRDGHIEAEDISDAAPTAGLQQTSTISASSGWQGTRLVAPRAKR